MIQKLLNQQAKLAIYRRRLFLGLQGVNVHSTCWIGKQVEVHLGSVKDLPGYVELAKQVKLEQGVILDA